MAALIYGPDPFTVGSDTELSAYNADWDQFSVASEDIVVNAANDRLQPSGTGYNADYRWTGQVVLDQRITASAFFVGSGTWTSFWLRADGEGNGYLIEWDSSNGVIYLYRATGFVGGGGGSFTGLAYAGTISNNTQYDNPYAKATGTNPVVIRCGDDTNGADVVSFDDSNAARHQSGQPGVSMDTFVTTNWMDNVAIWNEAAAPGRPSRLIHSSMRF